MTDRAPGRALALALAVALAAAACSTGRTAAPSPAPTAAPTAAAAGCPTSAPPPLALADVATVTLDTAYGRIVIRIEGKLAPNATANFLALARCGYYNGVIFHRIAPGFVIQGGDGVFGKEPVIIWRSVGHGGPGYTIPDDPVATPYARGTVAMARTPAPNSAGSQFFIVLDDKARQSLQSANTYAILGTVVEGMDAVDAIAAVPTTTDGRDAPTVDPPPSITTATVSGP